MKPFTVYEEIICAIERTKCRCHIPFNALSLKVQIPTKFMYTILLPNIRIVV